MVAALLLVGSLPPLKADNDGAPAGKPVRGEKRIKEAVESGKITKEEAYFKCNRPNVLKGILEENNSSMID